jgi:Tfp pilus assembly protein PilE
MLVRRMLIGVLLFVAVPVEAQTAADSVRALNARLKNDLRNLVVAQEAHFAQRAAYAPTVAALGAGYRPSLGVTVEPLNAGSNGYGAVARTVGSTGSCVVHINVPAAQWPRTDVEKKAGPEGEPVCDGDGTVAQLGAAAVLVSVSKLQERHFGRTGGYASDVAALTGLRIPRTVTVTIEFATTSGANPEPVFLATATDSRYPGYSCVLASGWVLPGATTLAEKKHAGGGGTAVCDTFK